MGRINCAPLLQFKAMAYTIKYFKPEIEKKDPLKTQYYIRSVNDEYVLFVNGVPTTFVPNVWSTLLCNEFNADPSQFVRDNWVNLSFLNSIKSCFNSEANKLKNSLSLEQQFIIDNLYAKCPKSGSSFVSVKLDGNKISYSMLGDNFLFLYNEKTKSLLAYCSMVDKNGQLDLSQPCHCIYNDLSLLGTPINGQKSLKDSICFILSRDLASWFVDNCKGNLLQTIETLLSITNDEDYNKLLHKISSQQRYKGISFDKSTSCCIIIQRDKVDIKLSYFDKILTWCRNHIVACTITTAALILIIFFVFGNFGNKEKKEETGKKDSVKVETKSLAKNSINSTIVDNYKYYHDLLADDNLSFKSVKEMLVKADSEKLKDKNNLLYDTIYSYAHFVNRYNVTGTPRLRLALLDLFSNDPNGIYTIHRNDSNSLVLSTNLNSGELLFFQNSHKRNIIELFIGKYDDAGQIRQYSNNEKKNRYKRAIQNCNVWKSFADMK